MCTYVYARKGGRRVLRALQYEVHGVHLLENTFGERATRYTAYYYHIYQMLNISMEEMKEFYRERYPQA